MGRAPKLNDPVDRFCGSFKLLSIEGVPQAQAQRPHVVISDIAMPQVDGYELVRRIRQQPELQGVVLVALTGYGQDADRAEAQRAGFDHHMVKPVSQESLEALLRSLAAPPGTLLLSGLRS